MAARLHIPVAEFLILLPAVGLLPFGLSRLSAAQDDTKPASQARNTSEDKNRQFAVLEFRKTLATFLDDKDTKRAREGFLRAIVLDPTLSAPYFNLGIISESEEDWSGAAKWFATFLRLDPASNYAGRARGEITRIATIRRLVATPGGLTKTHYDDAIQRARLFLRSRMPKEAVAEAGEAVKMDPSRWEAYAVASSAFSQGGQQGKAKDFLAMAIERAPVDKKPQLKKAMATITDKSAGKQNESVRASGLASVVPPLRATGEGPSP
jgi:tetratricopeptide (TPR) repeat protein